MESTDKRELARLFLMGFAQVLLVAVNTYQVSHSHFVGAVIVSFGISYMWTCNVKRAAFGTRLDKIMYAGGAACGTLTGMTAMALIY